MTLSSLCWLEAWYSFVLKREYNPLYSKLFSQIARIILYSSFLASYMKGAGNSSQAKASSASLVHSASSSLLQHAMHIQPILVTRASRLSSSSNVHPQLTLKHPTSLHQKKKSNFETFLCDAKYWKLDLVRPESAARRPWHSCSCGQKWCHALPASCPTLFHPPCFRVNEVGGILDLRF